MTQLELANAIGMDPMAVSRWERGVTAPRIEAIFRLCEVLGGDVATFYARDAA